MPTRKNTENSRKGNATQSVTTMLFNLEMTTVELLLVKFTKQM